MSSKIDLSQYRRQSASPQQASSDQQKVDLSQFKRKESRSALQKAGRLGAQTAIGIAEGATLPYNIVAGGAHALSEFGHENLQKQAQEELKILESKKAEGTLSAREQKYFDRIKRIAEEGPRKIPDLTVGGLVEKGVKKATGVDLRPQGVAEYGLRFAGMLKNPAKIASLGKLAMDAVKDPKKALQLAKTLTPGGKELARGFGAGFALQEAKDGDFGPIATIAATVAGDLIGGGLYGGAKGSFNILRHPKEYLAKNFAKMAKNSESEIRKQIIQDFRKAGIQADIGTITGNNLVQSIQAKLAASGLVGKPLENLRKQITSQVESEYKAIADGIGELKHASNQEVGEAVQSLGRSIRDTQMATNRSLYEAAEQALPENAFVNSQPLLSAVQKIEKDLKPGKLKSPEQQKVLKALEDMKSDLVDTQGIPAANVKTLSNMKKAINDIVDFDVQGGQKQRLIGLGKEIDRLLEGYGAFNPEYAKKFQQAQKAHAQHAKTFRDNAVEKFLQQNTNPATIMSKMGNIHEIRQIQKALSSTPEGKELFNQIKRFKLEQMIGDKMIDSTTEQLKYGTFSKLLEKGQNEAVVRELLGQESLDRLKHIQKASGQLAQSAQKFLNTSQSATSAVDMAAYTKILFDAMAVFGGNYWPFIRTLGVLGASKALAKTISDPEFLKLVEDAIIHKNSPATLQKTWPKLLEKAKELGMRESRTAAYAAIEPQQEDQSL